MRASLLLGYIEIQCTLQHLPAVRGLREGRIEPAWKLWGEQVLYMHYPQTRAGVVRRFQHMLSWAHGGLPDFRCRLNGSIAAGVSQAPLLDTQADCIVFWPWRCALACVVQARVAGGTEDNPYGFPECFPVVLSPVQAGLKL
jgi:hypothetical protein